MRTKLSSIKIQQKRLTIQNLILQKEDLNKKITFRIKKKVKKLHSEWKTNYSG